MDNITTTIKGLFIGKPKKLPNSQMSATRKDSVDSIKVFKDRIEGDEVFNKLYHGGQMRVIHHYTGDNYNILKEDIPEISDRFIAGSFGENIYTDELDESKLCIGDIFKVADQVMLQVTVTRRPCQTLNVTYENPSVLKSVIKNGHCGWFYRVLEPGVIRVGDKMALVQRPHPNLKLNKLHAQGYSSSKFSDEDFLIECMDSGLLDKGWEPKISSFLAK